MAQIELQEPNQTSNENFPAGLESSAQATPALLNSNCSEEKTENNSDSEETVFPSSGYKEAHPGRKQPSRKKISFWRFLLMYHRNEATAVLALAFTLLSSVLQIQSSSSKGKLLRRSAPVAQRFFASNSAVLDLFHGNGGDTLTLTSSSEVVLLMYYAPWCAQCQEMRWHMDKLSRNFSPLHQVKFVAINCWDPGGRCKQSYKLYTYPVLAVYPGSSQLLFYTGHLAVDYLYRFLEEVLDPVVRLQNSDDVERFFAGSDICLIAFFDFASFREPPGYLSFHKTAQKYLEKDPMGAIRFGLITQPNLAVPTLNMTENREVRLYQLRHFYDSTDFISFPKNQAFKSGEILKWTFSQLQTAHSEGPAVTWIPVGAPLGYKNDHLQDILREGATAILFTPRHPLTEKFGLTTDFAVFRQVALEYLDCSWGDGQRMKNARRLTRSLAEERLKNIARWAKECREWTSREKTLKSCCQDIVLTTVSAPTNKNICDVCNTAPTGWGFRQSGSSPSACVRSTSVGGLEEMDLFSAAVSRRTSCEELSDFLPAPTLVDYCCHLRQKTGLENGVFDAPVKQERRIRCDRKCLTEKERREELSSVDGCRRFRLAKLLGYHLGDTETKRNAFDSEPSREFYGMGCETNKTLRFVAMDSRHYSWLGDKIGIIDSSSSTKSKVVIVDNETESQYILNEELSLSRLREAIKNFTTGHLDLVARSEKVKSVDSKSDPSPLSDSGNDVIRMERVSSGNFRQKVLDSDKDVLLFYTGGAWCGFCSSVFHILLATATYFRDMKDKLTFAKIDASENDLPWEYSIDKYPAILFFPRLRKTESVKFPEFLPITLPNVLSFVLAHSHPEIRWRTALGVCSTNCIQRNRFVLTQRLDFLRTEVRLLKAQLRDSVRERMKMENYQSYWNLDQDGPMFDIFVKELRKELGKKLTQRKILKIFLRLLQRMDSAGKTLTEQAKEAIMLEFLVKNHWSVPLSGLRTREKTKNLLRQSLD